MLVHFHRFFVHTLFIVLICLPETLFARHIIGGEITYRYLSTNAQGDNRYEFTMKIYRDCFGGGAGFDNPAEMAIYRGTYASNVLLNS